MVGEVEHTSGEGNDAGIEEEGEHLGIEDMVVVDMSELDLKRDQGPGENMTVHEIAAVVVVGDLRIASVNMIVE